jgi:phage recombination protein Bet
MRVRAESTTNRKENQTMSTALVKLDFDKEQMSVIESQFFPQGASKAEQAYCFSVARELCLNPITREIFFVSRRQKVGDKWVSKVEPMVGRDGFLSIAHRTNKFAGIETTTGIREVPQLESGQWKLKPQLVAECTVWRKDSSKPFTAQVAYNEYCQKTAEGQLTRFWAEKPETMLKKVAESQALRKAFNIHGVYCPEELGAGFELASGEIVTVDTDTTGKPGRTCLALVNSTPTRAALPEKTHLYNQTISGEVANLLATDAGSGNRKVFDEAASRIIELLKGKQIPYDITINGNDGVIAAKSFNEKDLLKANNFKWSSDQKRWLYRYKNEPF